jgi:hypothetical protein
VSDEPAHLIESDKRASLHALLAQLGSRCFQLASELRQHDVSGGLYMRADEVRDELLLAAKVLGASVDGLRSSRVTAFKRRKHALKIKQVLRDMAKEPAHGQKKFSNSPVVSAQGRTSNGARSCRQRREVSDSSRRSR